MCYNKPMVKERVFQTIKKHDLIQQGAQVIVGISGGPDSVCLLHILSRLVPELQLKLSAVHVNHGLRGAAADEDEKRTAAFCDSLGVPCRIFRVDAGACAKEQGLTVEEAGRRLRYDAFETVRKELGDARIAVAHNADDQAETVLMRILRGTGISGLGGMEYLRQDGVIRPLLDISRKEIEDYCREHALDPCMDQSNESTDYTRNRIRLELLPYVRENFNVNINDTLARLAAIAREESSWVDSLAEKHLAENEGLLLAPLRELSPVLRKRVLLLALKRAGLEQDVAAVHLDAAEKMVMEGTVSKQTEFPHGYVLKMGYERVEIICGTLGGELPQGGKRSHPGVPLDRGGSIVMKRVSREEYVQGDCGLPPSLRDTSLASEGGCRAFISVDHVEEAALTVRTRRPGDFICPFGMKGRKSLQNYFVDRKVPRELRDRLPLLCFGQEVLWIPGLGMNEICRITDATENILSLEYFE
ncbi:MAG: tRNA lysidine(34) synthetase TilS [Firmicutes bacterium]|nr:tRNA lysidine(34) synthetase TilS [Bacillota bacterium]